MNSKLIAEINEALQKAKKDAEECPMHYLVGKYDGIKLITEIIKQYYDI